MLSGEVAKSLGISVDTLRHYERIGLIQKPRRTAGGYRIFDAAAVEELRLSRRGLAMGFTLRELVKIARVRRQGGSPCGQVRALAGAKLEGIERRIEELTRHREELQGVIASWDERLANTSEGERAGLLAMVPEEIGLTRERVPGLRIER